jgi:hypothetical protein
LQWITAAVNMNDSALRLSQIVNSASRAGHPDLELSPEATDWLLQVATDYGLEVRRVRPEAFPAFVPVACILVRRSMGEHEPRRADHAPHPSAAGRAWAGEGRRPSGPLLAVHAQLSRTTVEGDATAQ